MLRQNRGKIGEHADKGLFKRFMTYVQTDNASVANMAEPSSISKSFLWHRRLGHIVHGELNAIVKQKLDVGINITAVNK